MVLNGNQFRMMKSSFPSRGTGFPDQRSYTMVDRQDQAHALMSVMDYSNSPTQREPWNNDPWKRSINEYSDGEPRPGQQMLFRENYEGKPGTSKLTNAAMTKGARAMTMPLLAQAAKDTAEMGRQLEPSENLSAHSAPLVQRLKKAGLVGEGAVESASNQVTFMDSSWEYAENPTSTHEEMDMRGASRLGRSILRQARPPKPDASEQQEMDL